MSASVEKRVAIVGDGPAAESYLAALGDLPELLLDAVVEAEREGAERGFGRGVRIFRSVEDLVRYRALPDVAIVCTPPATHFDVAGRLLCAGTDLLVQAPLATTLVEAERLAEIADRTGRELMTAGAYGAAPGLLGAARALRAGRIGRLHGVELALSEKLDPRVSWRGDPLYSGGGVWMDLGPHALDALELLAGPVCGIRMLESLETQGAGVEDEVCVETDHADGVRGQIRASWNRHGTEPIARCVGEDGELVVGLSQAVLRGGAGERVLGPGCDEREGCQALLQEFLRRRCSPNPPEDAGPRTVGWLEAAYRSVRDQRWQS